MHEIKLYPRDGEAAFPIDLVSGKALPHDELLVQRILKEKLGRTGTCTDWVYYDVNDEPFDDDSWPLAKCNFEGQTILFIGVY